MVTEIRAKLISTNVEENLLKVKSQAHPINYKHSVLLWLCIQTLLVIKYIIMCTAMKFYLLADYIRAGLCSSVIICLNNADNIISSWHITNFRQLLLIKL